MKKIQAIDLFCGAGGLTCGLIRSGVQVVAGVDSDADCEYVYKTNNHSPIILKDIREVSGAEVASLYDEDAIKVLAGCAPCQPFSSYTFGHKKKDDKWSLLDEFKRLIKEISPEIVTMENVPNLPKHEIFYEFIKGLESAGYYVSNRIVNCPEYGIPQSRKRLVLLASKFGPIELVKPTHTKPNYVTVRHIIEKLPEIKAGSSSSLDPIHIASKLSDLNLERIRHSKQGGTWKDWPKHLVAKCHKKISGGTYSSVYGRMSWDAPAPTMTTQCYGFGNGRFGHPTQDRGISLREAALFQTFPKDYKFHDSNKPFSMRVVGKLIGNAVPVRLGEVVGESILKHLENSYV